MNLDTNSVIAIASIITSITTVIYTFGTFLLWNMTKKSIDLSTSEIKRKQTLLEIQSISSIYRNFRDIYTVIIDDNDGINLLTNAQSGNKEMVKKEYFSAFLINHTYEMYLLNNSKLLPIDFWERSIIDMKELYSWPFIKERWKKMNILFPSSFRNFIDEKILREKIF